jgi:putative methionine-R-sulfoxide reductase with GAF domain
MANTVSPRLKSCISLPIVKQGTLLGVLSLYSVADDPYSESHKRILETVLQLSGLCSHDDLLAGGDRHEQQTVATRDF